MAGFDSVTNALFRDAVASLFDSTCSVVRDGALTSNGRFGGTRAETTIATGVSCSVQHESNGSRNSVRFAERLGSRVFTGIYVARRDDVHMDDRIVVDGTVVYEVIGQPYLDGPDDPCLMIPCAAIAPALTT